MKKIVVIVMALAVIGVYEADAQVRFGIKGGLNLASASIESATNLETSSKTGYHAGIYLAFKFTKIAIQPEVLWSVQGVKTTADILGTPVEFDTDLNYVNIPVMVKIYLVQGLHLELGPTFGILMTAETEGQDIKETLNSSDISASFGLGFDAPMGLGGGVRYNLGVTEVLADPVSGDSWTNNNFMISVWYAIKK